MAQALTLPRPIDGLRQLAARARARAEALWRAHPRETLGAGLLAAGTPTAGAPPPPPAPLAGGAEAAPPARPPLIMRQLPPEQALKLNAEIPVASEANPAAAPFAFKG